MSAQSLRVHGTKRDEPDDPVLKAQRQEMGRRAVQARIARKAAREAAGDGT